MSECVVAGDSDIFGLGVRIGFYLTGLSLILSKIFCPSRLSGIATSIGLLQYVIFFALIKKCPSGISGNAQPISRPSFDTSDLTYVRDCQRKRHVWQ
jgi:hypothetical protein